MESPLRLYERPGCPFSLKVRLALGHKGLELEAVAVGDDDRAEVVRLTGQPLVPVLVHGERAVADSHAILRYLDLTWREGPRLFTEQRGAMGAIEQWELFAVTRLAPAWRAALASAGADPVRPGFLAAAREVEVTLAAGELLGGSVVSAADLSVAPFLALGLLAEGAEADPARAWCARHLALPPALARVRTWVDRVLSGRAPRRVEAWAPRPAAPARADARLPVAGTPGPAAGPPAAPAVAPERAAAALASAPAVTVVASRPPVGALPADVEVLLAGTTASARADALRAARGAVVLSLAPGCAPDARGLAAARAHFERDRELGFLLGPAVWRHPAGGRDVVSTLPPFEGKRRFLAAPFEPPALAVRRDLLAAALPRSTGGGAACLHAAAVEALAHLAPGATSDAPLAVQGEPRPALPRTCGGCVEPCGVATRRLEPAWDGAAWRVTKVALAVTTRCNFDCDYCFTRRLKLDLPRETARRAILEALDAGAERVVFTGGEPTLHPCFDELFDLAARGGLHVDVLTNGWSWPEERLARVVSYPRLRFGLALQGAREPSHDAGRGPGAWRVLHDFLGRARALRPDVPTIALVVATRDNVGELAPITRYCLDDLGVNELRLDRVVRTGNASERYAADGELARAYRAEAEALAARYPDRVAAVTRGFEGGCPVLDDPSSLEVLYVGNGAVPACAYLTEDRRFDLGTTDEPLAVLASAERVQRARHRVAVLFRDAARHRRERGLFTCVECIETWHRLTARGELDAALAEADAAAPRVLPWRRPASALDAPRVRDVVPPWRRAMALVPPGGG